MKKILVVMVVVVVALMSATAAMATIAGSKHDFSTGGTTTYTGGSMSACQYCHTPHHAASASAPLWNRTLKDTVASPFTTYGTGTTATLSGSFVNQPGANSLTCLSCHDGSQGVGSVLHGNADTIVATNILDASGAILSTAAGFIGTNLQTTHPIGVVYNSTVVGPGLSNVFGTGNTINGKKWKIYGGANGVGRVECGSCHDPHNTTAGERPFLKDTLNSMCTDCHATK